MERARDIIMAYLKNEDMSQTDLSHRMGIDIRALNQMLTRQKDLKFESFRMMMECMGYKLVFEKMDEGMHRTGKKVGRSIIEKRTDNGRFWFEDGDKYVGIINYGSGLQTKEFDDKAQLIRWLERDGA